MLQKYGEKISIDVPTKLAKILCCNVSEVFVHLFIDSFHLISIQLKSVAVTSKLTD